MRVGINLLLWTDHPSGKHGALLASIKKWGFDGVEFPVISMEPADVKEMAKRSDDLGLQRSALLAYGAEQADPPNPDPKLRQAAVDLIKKSIDQTRELGADILVGPIQAGLGRFTGAGPSPDEWKRAVEVIRTCGEHAATMHVRLGVEPLNRFEMFLMNTVKDGARFCRDVDLPNVGMLADTHHSNIEEEKTADAWSQVAAHIYHVHISENHRGTPGSGHAVTPQIFEALKKAKYDGWMTIEAFGLKVPSLIPPLHLWRKFFEKEEEVAVLGLKHIREGWKRAAA